MSCVTLGRISPFVHEILPCLAQEVLARGGGLTDAKGGPGLLSMETPVCWALSPAPIFPLLSSQHSGRQKNGGMLLASLVSSQCPCPPATQATLPQPARPSSPYLIPISSITLEHMSLFSLSWV